MASMTIAVEQVANSIARMGRRRVKQEILHFKGRFRLDFSEKYLDSLPLERLRHILLAAKVQQLRIN